MMTVEIQLMKDLFQ